MSKRSYQELIGDYMKNVKSKEVKKYLDMPYSYVITQVNDESGKYFVARVLELDGLIGTGDTYNEAYEDIKLAMESYIETKLANNVKIPMPIDSSEYSGRFVVRLPKTLHKLISKRAKEEGISLNQYAVYKLAL